MTLRMPDSDPSTSLDDIQHWMQRIIMHPEGVAHGLAAGTGCDVIDVSPENLESVINRSQKLTAEERLQIYNYAYSARLIECRSSSE